GRIPRRLRPRHSWRRRICAAVRKHASCTSRNARPFWCGCALVSMRTSRRVGKQLVASSASAVHVCGSGRSRLVSHSVGYGRVACARSECRRLAARSLFLGLFVRIDLSEHLLELLDEPINLWLLPLTARQPMREAVSQQHAHTQAAYDATEEKLDTH